MFLQRGSLRYPNWASGVIHNAYASGDQKVVRLEEQSPPVQGVDFPLRASPLANTRCGNAHCLNMVDRVC